MQSRATGSQHLNLAHWNAEGIRKKKQDLQHFLRHNKIDVWCGQETHLTDQQPSLLHQWVRKLQTGLGRTKQRWDPDSRQKQYSISIIQ